MKINWKLRLKNKTTLLSLLLCVVAFVYQVLGIIGIVPAVAEATVTQLITLVVNVFVALGVIVDPTTKGITDSNKALTYEAPIPDTDDIEEILATDEGSDEFYNNRGEM